MTPGKLDHLRLGDIIARRITERFALYNDFVEYEIHKIVHTTRTTVVTENGMKVRRKDGYVLGEKSSLRDFEPATLEIIALHEKQLALVKRHRKAGEDLCDLIGIPHHRFNRLSIEQKELLAKAWAEVKALKAPKKGDAA